MKIVFLETDTLGNKMDYKQFDQFGQVKLYGMSKLEDVKERIVDADIVIVNKIPMMEETLKFAEKLKLICVTATGTNNVDFHYTNSKGIVVTNVKGYSTSTVVQHTFALYFYLAEHLPYYDDYVKSGKYIQSSIFTHFEREFHDISNLTWGIVGLGEIGRGVAKVAEAFGCHVIYFSTSGKNHNIEYESVGLDYLLANSDVISIHAPLNENTNHLFQKEQFQKMKSTAYLINVGRGPIIKEADLKGALEQGEIAGAALDVLDVEPMQTDNPLNDLKKNQERLLITPHIAWASLEARQRLLGQVAMNIEAYLNGKERNVVK